MDNSNDVAEHYAYTPFISSVVRDGEDAIPLQNDFGFPVIGGEDIEFSPTGIPRYATTGELYASPMGNPFMYNGAQWDAELGMYYMRARYMDPLSGRFTSVDPIGVWGDGYNRGNGYAYVGNNPYSYSDPFGLRRFGETAGVSGYLADSALVAQGYFITGPVNMASGLATVVAHPVMTAQGIGAALGNLGGSASALGSHISASFEDPAMAGTLVFDVASIVAPVGLKGADKFGGVARLSHTLDYTSRLGAHVLSNAAVPLKNSALAARYASLLARGGASAEKCENVAGTYRDANGKLHNAANGQFAPDGGPKPKQNNGINGNSRNSPREATLYGRYDVNDVFEKWGVTQDMNSRYTPEKLGDSYLVPLRTGSRGAMYDLERYFTERVPGPLNHESWAGTAPIPEDF